MKRIIYMFASFSIMLMLLSGCGQIEDIINSILSQADNDNNNNIAMNNDDEDDWNNDENNNDNDVNDDADQPAGNNNDTNNDDGDDGNLAGYDNTSQNETPFDDRLIEQGYELITLPNGFDFQVPYHWVLVDTTDGKFTFCYDLPLSIEDVNQVFEGFDIVSDVSNPSPDVLHQTEFVIDTGYDSWEGSFTYFLDDYDNTCVTYINPAYVNETGEWDGPGEDPATMADDDEPLFFDDIVHDEGRTRHLASGYEDWFQDYKDMPSDFIEPGDAESIRAKIASGEFDMLHLANGHPVIFPYEWYLMEKTDDDYNGGWEGTYCTDATLKDTVVKHVNMLEQLNADIYEYEDIPSPSMNKKAEFKFAFNDIYGTGSWEGSTIVYIDRLQAYQTHKCVMVKMQFSPDVLQ